MNRIINWRYEKWDNNEKNNDKKYSEDDISDYISWEIYPEDIELFITVLAPRTIIYKGCVIRCKNENKKKSICQRFDSWLLQGKDLHIAQAQINMCSIADIFLNTSENTSDSTIENLANLIKDNWELHLQKTYPDRDFVVYIAGEGVDLVVIFFEKTLPSEIELYDS